MALSMELALGSSGGLMDGSTSWGQSAEAALSTWNPISVAQFRVVRFVGGSEPNGINNVFWSSSIYGDLVRLHDTQSRECGSRGATMTETDVIFNTAFRSILHWTAAPQFGRRTLQDFRRVMIHDPATSSARPSRRTWLTVLPS